MNLKSNSKRNLVLEEFKPLAIDGNGATEQLKKYLKRDWKIKGFKCMVLVWMKCPRYSYNLLVKISYQSLPK